MINDLRARFVDVYGLDIDPASVADDEPLFGPDSRFELDSMDTLRFIAALHETYGFDLGSATTDSFRTIASVARTLGAPATAG